MAVGVLKSLYKNLQTLCTREKLQYSLELLTHLPRRSRVYYSRLSLRIPAVRRFFTEERLRSGS